MQTNYRFVADKRKLHINDENCGGGAGRCEGMPLIIAVFSDDINIIAGFLTMASRVPMFCR